MAQLPSVGHEQFYSILAANDDLVFMHVDEPGGEWDRAVSDGDRDTSQGWGNDWKPLCSKQASTSPEHGALHAAVALPCPGGRTFLLRHR